ncbi:MAG: hypothetical protein JNK12_22915 [Acidimicrobiales bacterium]|nr:hypothetical protein [Acidimicrobiales bacterium]
MRAIDLPVGAATSIGSLPHTAPDQAVALVLDEHGWLPAAPSLPRRSPLEGMIAQAAWGMPGVTVADDGSLDLVLDRIDPEAPPADADLSGAPFLGLRVFLDAVAGRTGWVKLQLTGPVTLGLALHAAGLDAERAFMAAGTAVRARAEALLALAARKVPDAPLLVFVDEPGLASCMHPGFPIEPDRAVDLVSGALASIEPHAVTGLHCCGNADWRLVLQAGPQVLSAPVDAGLGDFAGTLGSFLDRGGWVAWGAVPTDGPLGTTADRLWRHLCDLWCEMVRAGCDPVLLRTQAMVTPACGLALHGEPQAAHVLSLARNVAQRLHDQAVGVRLTAGA